jgi:hypothetical protein
MVNTHAQPGMLGNPVNNGGPGLAGMFRAIFITTGGTITLGLPGPPPAAAKKAGLS